MHPHLLASGAAAAHVELCAACHHDHPVVVRACAGALAVRLDLCRPAGCLASVQPQVQMTTIPMFDVPLDYKGLQFMRRRAWM